MHVCMCVCVCESVCGIRVCRCVCARARGIQVRPWRGAIVNWRPDGLQRPDDGRPANHSAVKRAAGDPPPHSPFPTPTRRRPQPLALRALTPEPRVRASERAVGRGAPLSPVPTLSTSRGHRRTRARDFRSAFPNYDAPIPGAHLFEHGRTPTFALSRPRFLSASAFSRANRAPAEFFVRVSRRA